MKSISIQILFLFIFSGLSAQSHPEGKGQLSLPNYNHASRQLQSGSLAGENVNIVYQRLELTVDPAVKAIKGKISSHFIPLQDKISTISFEMSSPLILDSAVYHGSILGFARNNSELTITFSSPLDIGVLDSISLYYKGNPVSTGNGSFAVSPHNGVPCLWTLSQPDGARDWWPCKQSLNDKIDSVEIIVTCPAAYRTASNGILVNEYIKGGSTICHWKTKYPIATYLIAIAVSNYKVYKDSMLLRNGEHLQILNYIYPEDSLYVSELDKIKPLIHLYDSLGIPYPFSKEKYGHAQFGWNGGMEHQTMSFVVNFSFDLLAHELAHQWFGDFITCRSWKDIWLNEGFATYFEGLAQQHLSTGSNWLYWKQSNLSNACSILNGTVYNPDTLNENRIFDPNLSYSKGAYVVHMLRWKLGDSLFFAAIRSYLNDTKLQFSYASSQDLIAHFEAVSGMDLSGFFDDYLYGKGFPYYGLDITYSFKSVNVKINQISSDPSVSFFEMPIPVRFMNGAEDTTIVFNPSFTGQSFTAALPFRPLLVAFDPENWVLGLKSNISFTNLNLVDTKFGGAVRLFPNPGTDLLTLQFDAGFQINSFRIISLLGETVYSSNSISGKSEILIPIQTLNDGFYIIEICTENGIFTDKFLKKSN